MDKAGFPPGKGNRDKGREKWLVVHPGVKWNDQKRDKRSQEGRDRQGKGLEQSEGGGAQTCCNRTNLEKAWSCPQVSDQA